MSSCEHEKAVCPRHNGGFDCNPFCDFCEGEQEFCRLCDALETVLGDLEYNNNHTLGKLLIWAYREETLTNDQALQFYRAWLLARDFICYGKNGDNKEELAGYLGWLEIRKEQELTK